MAKTDGSAASRGGESGPVGAMVAGRSEFLGFLVKRLGNRADAEDVLQDFCIRVLTRKDQLRDAGRMDAWLYSVLRSALNDHYRKTGRRKRLGEAFAIETQSPEATADAAEAMTQMCGCVKRLVPELRDADADLIRRIDFKEESRAAVAADLALKPGTLAVRLHRARAALADVLLGHCGHCCKHGFEDCSCPPAGCENPLDATSCESEVEVA